MLSYLAFRIRLSSESFITSEIYLWIIMLSLHCFVSREPAQIKHALVSSYPAAEEKIAAI